MCGITLCIKGIDVSKLHFFFDLFQLYRENPFNSFALSKAEDDYLTYMLKKQLFINDFSPQHIFDSIDNRGPDVFRCFKISMPLEDSKNAEIEEIKNTDKDFTSNIFDSQNKESNNQDSIQIYAACSVLHLRGEKNHPVAQPLINFDTGNVLLYNGEIFNIEKRYLEHFTQKKSLQAVIDLIHNFNPYDNDTAQVLNILNTYSLLYKSHSATDQSLNYIEDVRDMMNCFNADFSFIFLDILNRKISFGKDIFGKRGLVLGLRPNGICLSSCSINTAVSHSDLQEETGDGDEELKQDSEPALKNHSGLLKEQMKEEFLEKKYNNEYFSALEKTWVEIPANRVFNANISKDESVKLSFSQIGLSSIRNTYSLQREESIKLEDDFNVATQQGSKYLRESLINIVRNIIAYKPFFDTQSTAREANDEEKKIDDPPQNITKEEDGIETSESKDSSLSILFSGGLDSTLLALICTQILPEGARIDLFNIAFMKDAPDRETGIRAYHEIKKYLINPKANLRLILIDKSLDDTAREESKIIKLIYPKITHMDFNIGAALHLASRGEGILYKEDPNEPTQINFKMELVHSKARIILSGLGADEVFGGYSRYRVAFLRGGYEELHNEMSFDLNRLWIRNLGRDDRSISANSKEVRFPFLNRQLIEYVATVKPELLTNFAMPRGTGDKILLRNIAKELGLEESHAFKKRAIQFGTKLARLSNIKAFGSNRKAKGTALYKK